MALFAGKTVFVFTRSLMPGLGEILVASSAAPTLRDQHALAGSGQVGNGFTCLVIERDCAERDLQDHVLTGVAGTVRAFAVAPAVRLEFTIVAVTQKRVVVGIRFEVNAATVATIATGRAAARDVLLPTKRDAAVAAVARLDRYFRFISKHENHTPKLAPVLGAPLKTIAQERTEQRSDRAQRNADPDLTAMRPVRKEKCRPLETGRQRDLTGRKI